ncbi:MAG: reverse transcriptase domain-containing protein [bacterium]|nr:reverse transcriptase domain-containing protein [bacterium]
MFESIISLENLLRAWRVFRRGKSDKPDVQSFERRLEDNLFSLHNDLSAKQYRHGLYERFHLFDPKHRIIHKAEVRDRVVHHAIYRILAPVFEQSFIFDSYSCRLDKGTHAGVDRLEQFARKVSRNFTRTCFALKCDIRKFFDSIDHSILINMITRRISDPNTLWLLREIIESYSSREREREREREQLGFQLETSLPSCSRICI